MRTETSLKRKRDGQTGRKFLLGADFLLLLGIALLLYHRPFTPAGGREEPSPRGSDFLPFIKCFLAGW